MANDMELKSLGGMSTSDGKADAEMQASLKSLANMRPSVVLVVVVQSILSILIFVMAYSKGGTFPVLDDDGNQVVDEDGAPQTFLIYYSPNIALCAFGSVNVLIFAIVDAYDIFQKTSKKDELPTWKWHTDGFQSLLGNMFFLTLFMWPALVIYILHARGAEFADIFSGLNSSQRFSVLLHIITGLLLLIIDLYGIVRTTKLIGVDVLDPEDNDKKKKEDNATDAVAAALSENMEVKSGDIDDDDDDDDGDGGIGAVGNDDDDADAADDDAIDATGCDTAFGWIMIVLHLLFVVELWMLMAAAPETNSGMIGSGIIMAILFLYSVFTSFKHLKKKKLPELFLHDLRLGIVFHFFLAFCVWWVSISIYLFLIAFDESFFDAVTELSGDRQFVVFLVLVSFIIAILTYVFLLLLHQKGIWSNNRIAMLRLFEEFTQYN